jgi:predicted permease
VRQLLSESLLLGLLGSVAGVFVAWWAVSLLVGLTPLVSLDLDPDARVLLFALAAALVTGAACGLAPALQATRPGLTAALKDEGGLGGYRRSRLRGALVVAQIAISALLLIGSGLFLRSLMNAGAIDPGFNAKSLLLVTVTLGDRPAAQGGALYLRVLERLRGLPGVRGASTVNQPGLNFDGARRGVNVEGYARRRGEDMEVAFNVVGPGYFQTMQTPLVGGRDFTERDVRGAPGVVIVNETFARRYFPGQGALGRRLSVTGEHGEYLEVVGVARDAKYWSLGEEPRPFFSLPLLQHYQDGATLLVRTEGDPRPLAETARRELLALDRSLLVTETTTMTEHLGAALLPLRVASVASAVFGLLALLLASVGVYGVVAFFVGQRTREIGVRIALGAGRGDILRLVLGQSLTVVLAGIALGLAGAFALSRLLASFLFGVSATDLATFVGVAALLGLTSLLAAWIPARRATKVDPMVALRSE